MRLLLTGLVGFLTAMGLVGILGETHSITCTTNEAAGVGGPALEGELLNLDAELIAEGFVEPTSMFQLPGDDRLYIAEKPGRIVIVNQGRPGDVIVDMRTIVGSEANEQGLLSVVPDPNFPETCLIYLFYTDVFGDSVLASALVQTEDDKTDIDLRSRRVLLEIPQDRPWHQSGSIEFDSEGNMWVSVGDGGGIGDPDGHGQNPGDIRGSLIRITPHRDGYSVPDDNPFTEIAGARPEIWAYGLRNPWRIFIDQQGLVYIPDVGQNEIEEVNIVPVVPGGDNFGWPITEGSRCFETPSCDTEKLTPPVHEYEHEGNGCAIVGGSVYRGRAIPELHGHYFYADFCGGWVRSFRYEGGEATEHSEWGRVDKGRLITTFSTDDQGELYYLNLTGELWKIVPVRE